ncbi:TraD N-terminal domain-containing protein [Legionella septentrionalis]|uniref:TraD N-terminal domain-containing protein n=1 Tax=Legionella septentrionalis TaxID=2498109 RepID=UPI001F296100|nr:TraD N-terminal domain-containing protein [Legionella septentrionalis]
MVGQKHTFGLSFHGKEYHQSVETILHYPYYAENAKGVLNLFGMATNSTFFIAP